MSGFTGIARVSALLPGVARSWRDPADVVELVLRIRARRTGIPAMVQALTTVMVQAGPQRGCVDCRLYAETGNPSSLCYVEQWSTVRDLQSRLRSPGFGMLLGIMETAAEAPALEVRTITEQRGLEYVRTIRLAPPTDPVCGGQPRHLASGG